MPTLTLTLPRPDDMHLHVRDGAVLRDVVPATARVFGRAILMPNLKPPVRTTAEAAAYRDRVLAAVPPGVTFEPLMVLYLTDRTDPAEMERAKGSGFVHGVKLYPAGATTNSDSGVTDIAALDPVFSAMADVGMPLLVHGEVTHGEVDVFDREAVFLEQVLRPLLARHPRLRCVLEHITTAEGVTFVRSFDDGRVGGTLTAHHLLLNRNALFEGGIRPHHYCLPVLKRESHRLALVEAAISGDPRFFLGTDSAPHPRHLKEHACGCAGMYTAPHALALYAEVFDAEGALDRLPAFASEFGAQFYGLPVATQTVTLRREPVVVPATLQLGSDVVVPFRAGGTVAWAVA
jgi:dihydroorotase